MDVVKEKAEKVKEAAKESLLGVEGETAHLSAQTRTDFMQYAVKDDESDEWYMGAKQFVAAVAPEGEDYVRIRCTRMRQCMWFKLTST